MRGWLIAGLLWGGAVAGASATQPDPVASYVSQTLHVSTFKRADADLNGDGQPEAFIYVTDRGYCGSGGCRLIVLSRRGNQYRSVLRSTVTQLPIRLLATSNHGWRDIEVTVSGGGITQPYMARLRFDGQRYTSNPTVPLAQPMTHIAGKF